MGFLFWMFIMWFVLSRLGRRRRRWRALGMGPGIWWMAHHAPHGPVRLMQQRDGVLPVPVPSKPLSPAERRERAMSDLRRQYVADQISVEEYEAGLDRVLRES
jgi:hypothetical protein